MSRLQERIGKLKDLREDLVERETKVVSKESFLRMLRYHIEFLTEIDKLVDAIKIGDAEGVAAFYKRRVDE